MATTTQYTSLKSRAASKVKKALGIKSRRKKSSGNKTVPEQVKKPSSIEETLRVQMRVSEQIDSRVRKALSKVAVDQKIESIVLPLEMLQQLQPADFPSKEEHEASQKRCFKLLETGLLLHPLLPLENDNADRQQLRGIVDEALEKPSNIIKNNESMQSLRSIVTSLACRTSDDGTVSGTHHWADGFPLNLKIYQMLLEACFDINDEASVIDELFEVVEQIKKTWQVLGMNQVLHNLCFLWIFFNRYTTMTDQAEGDLLNTGENLLTKVEHDAKALKEDAHYAKVLSCISSAILGWGEKRLVDYHFHFRSDNIESMACVVSMAVLSAKIMEEDGVEGDETDVGYEKVDESIKSSLRAAFAQVMEKEKSSKPSSKDFQNELPFMARLAEEVSKLAFTEKETFSPILKRWHPLAAGVAVATLHSCYGNELKQYVSGIDEISPDVLEVLKTADKLEKDLVQIAVENSVDSEDGGKSIIREMLPYEAESVTSGLVKSWITERTDRLKEWVNRSLQQEKWDPKATRERFALSAVEVLRIVDEAFEAFFLLPIAIHASMLPDLATGIDSCLLHYISMAKSGCGTYVPTIPPLTRCSRRSKLPGVFKRKEKAHKKTQGGTANDTSGTPQMCCRINTLLYIQTQLNGLAKREVTNLTNSESTQDISNGMEKAFKLSAAACEEGIQHLCEATANNVVYRDLSHLFWDGLYIGDVSSSRIEPFLQELDLQLEDISLTVHDNIRTRLVTQVMKVSFDGLLLVLLAGGPARAFTLQDYEMIEEDFRFLTDLFWSNGDGLPAELIDDFSITVKEILPLFQTDTESLIEKFRSITLDNCSSSTTKSKLPLPPTTGLWGPTEPNTVLRVLCYRNDEIAAKFLKKTYNLPKKL
ncbi:protein unc-13 homolog [Hibiscus syriacus]|uniref:protein unc-13 homolog n=1 Tax=Hibiscus syriacus TaxID=106335 RepID=UPI0019208E00|nr:protein unc-13 homolog [Hibiscus syriacus]